MCTLGDADLDAVVPAFASLEICADEVIPLILGLRNDVVSDRQGLSHNREVDGAILVLIDVLIHDANVERAIKSAEVSGYNKAR